MPQVALFFYFMTNSGPMWVHYGTYKSQSVAEKHLRLMIKRNAKLKHNLVVLPELSEDEAVGVSNV